MGRGHGGSRGSGPGGGGLARNLSNREREIKDSLNERMSIFDEKGNEVYRNENGDAHSVSFKGAEHLLKDNIYTHNHPSFPGEPSIPSFSEGDVVAAVVYNSKEMRAVAGNVTFSLKRPATGWGLVGKDKQGAIGVAFRDAKERVTRRLKYYVFNYKGDKQAALNRADRIMSHMVNKEAARILGWDYSHSRTK